MKNKKYNIINVNREKEEYVSKKAYEVIINNKLFYFVYDENDEFKGIVIDDENYNYAYKLIETKNYFKNRKEHLLKCKEKRKMKVIFQKSGGTSSGESSVVYLPNSWLSDMNITKEDREVQMIFNSEFIVIRKKSASDKSNADKI